MGSELTVLNLITLLISISNCYVDEHISKIKHVIMRLEISLIKKERERVCTYKNPEKWVED